MNLILLNEAGVIVPAQSPDGVIVHDTTAGLMWSADRIGDDEITLDAALKKAKKCSLGGFDDWRVPTIRERLSIVDYDRFNSALNTDVFKPCSGWELTASSCAWSREDVWFVYSDYGGALGYHRDYSAWLRVVRSVPALPASSQ